MKTLIARIMTACVFLTAFDLSAAPIKRVDVSTNPMFVMHVDCDALRQTYLGKYLLYQLDKPEVYSNMVTFQTLLSFDLRTQLHGFTVYSDLGTPTGNIIIVYADYDAQRVIALFKGSDSAEVITNRQHAIYSWIDKKNSPNERTYAGIQNGRLIFGKDKRAVTSAMDVIHGTASNLSSSKAFPEMTSTGNNDFVQMGARQFDFLGSDPNAALLKTSKHAKLRASEKDEQLTAVLTLEAEDELSARQMSIVSQGMIALMTLQKSKPKAAALANGVSLKQEGNELIVTFTEPSPAIIAAVKENSPTNADVRVGTK